MRNKNWFWGAFFIIAAALIIVYAMGLLAVEGITWWMLLLGAALAAVFLQSLFHISFFGILMSAALFCIVFAEPFHLGAITPWPVLIAALLGSIGLHVLFDERKWRKNWIQKHHHGSGAYNSATVEQIGDNVVECRVRFGGSSKYLQAENLEAVRISCKFGGLEVYFDQSTLSPQGAVVELDISCGGVELYIPRSWKVLTKASVSLGAVENGVNLPDSDAPALVLTGRVSLGGVEVHYV